MSSDAPASEPLEAEGPVLRPPLLIVLSAPSGGGKTTLCHQLLAHRPDLVRAVTCTTRPPRPGEAHGVDYHFLDPAAFQERLREGQFLEHATVYGHCYGTLKREVLDRLQEGLDVLLSVDVQGAQSIRTAAAADPALAAALVTVFLAPPSLAVLEERLRKRNQDTPAVIRERLAVAQAEMACWTQFHYRIPGSTVAEDLRRMQAIVEAEKMRTSRGRLTQ